MPQCPTHTPLSCPHPHRVMIPQRDPQGGRGQEGSRKVLSTCVPVCPALCAHTDTAVHTCVSVQNCTHVYFLVCPDGSVPVLLCTVYMCLSVCVSVCFVSVCLCLCVCLVSVCVCLCVSQCLCVCVSVSVTAGLCCLQQPLALCVHCLCSCRKRNSPLPITLIKIYLRSCTVISTKFSSV